MADRIDGNWWAKEGRTLSIDFQNTVTEGGKAIASEHDRHEFAYLVPAGGPGTSTEVAVVLFNDQTIRLAPSAGAQPGLRTRCDVPS